jgi:hypothetical protein
MPSLMSQAPWFAITGITCSEQPLHMQQANQPVTDMTHMRCGVPFQRPITSLWHICPGDMNMCSAQCSLHRHNSRGGQSRTAPVKGTTAAAPTDKILCTHQHLLVMMLVCRSSAVNLSRQYNQQTVATSTRELILSSRVVCRACGLHVSCTILAWPFC